MKPVYPSSNQDTARSSALLGNVSRTLIGYATTLFYRTLYRPLMRLAHRYNWHYAPVGGPDGNSAWCQWCGLRYTIPTPTFPLRRSVPQETK